MSALAVAGALLSRVSLFGLLILLARLLPPQGFGAYALLSVLGGLLATVVAGGGPAWLDRFTRPATPAARRAPRVWRLYLRACLGSVPLAGVIVLVAAAGAGQAYASATALAGAAAIALGLAETLLAILRAGNKPSTVAALRDLLAPAALVALVALVRPASLECVFALQLGVNLALVLGAALMIGLNVGTLLPAVPARQAARRMARRHTWRVVAATLTSRLAANIDTLGLCLLAGLAYGGEYWVAAAVALGVFPTPAGRATAAGRKPALLLGALAALAALWLLAEPLLGVLGDRFAGVAALMQVLAVLRCLELLWRVRTGRDAGVVANLAAAAGWGVVFVLLRAHFGDGPAALLGAIAASALRHLLGPLRWRGRRGAAPLAWSR